MLNEWKRVRVTQWTQTHDVRVRHYRKNGIKVTKVWEMQISHNLIGVTVPVVHSAGLVVIPLTFMGGYDGQHGWFKCDPNRHYMVVPEKWVELLGDAHDEEVAIATRACRHWGLLVETPEELQFERLRQRMKYDELSNILSTHAEADEGKIKRRNNLRGA